MRRLLWSALVLSLLTAPVFVEADALAISGGYFNLAGASNSAHAVLGSSGGLMFGGEVRYDLGPRVFFSVAARVFQKDGERVFVADPSSQVFKLGHPLKLRLLPVQASLGYRLGKRRFFGISYTPYFGAGAGIAAYQEESTVGGLFERQSFSKGSGHGLLGAELDRGPVSFAVEAQYSFVPNVVGMGGVSKVYGESDIGGFSVLAKIVLTPTRK